MVAWLSFTCSDCLDNLVVDSHEHVSAMPDHGCCPEKMGDSNEPGMDFSCETACAEVVKLADSSDIYTAVDEYLIDPVIPSEQYYLFEPNSGKPESYPDHITSSYNPDLPEKNRILLI
jgi:hypothetical protein